MSRKAIIVGGTGLIGSHVLKLLGGYDEVLALVRKPGALKEAGKAREIVVDFEKLNQSSVDFTDADVFCTVGTTIKKAGSQEAFRKVDFDIPRDLANAAKSARCFLIVTALGADSKSMVFYSRTKGEAENTIREANIKSTYVFRPSLLTGEREETRSGEEVGAFLGKIFSPLFIGGLKRYKPIHGEIVARAMIRAAEKAESGFHIIESEKILELGN